MQRALQSHQIHFTAHDFAAVNPGASTIISTRFAWNNTKYLAGFLMTTNLNQAHRQFRGMSVTLNAISV